MKEFLDCIHNAHVERAHISLTREGQGGPTKQGAFMAQEKVGPQPISQEGLHPKEVEQAIVLARMYEQSHGWVGRAACLCGQPTHVRVAYIVHSFSFCNLDSCVCAFFKFHPR